MSHSTDGSVNGKKDGRARSEIDADFEERLAEFLHHPFQMAEMGVLIDHQRFDLMKHRRVRRVGIAAIGASGRDHADGRLLRQHGAHLHRARMRAQHMARAVCLAREIERVVHLPRRMIGRDVELGEVVVVVFDVGTFGDRETQIGEDRGDLVQHLADGMDGALRFRTRAAG